MGFELSSETGLQRVDRAALNATDFRPLIAWDRESIDLVDTDRHTPAISACDLPKRAGSP
jgi:hypothetical protein